MKKLCKKDVKKFAKKEGFYILLSNSYSLEKRIGGVLLNSIAAYSESLVQKAIEQNASDIHFAPSPKYTEIYFRIHGKRTFYKTISEQKYKLLLTYYKFTSGMDIGETRRPQNGVIDLKVQQSRYFLRLSTLPVNKLESLAIRILPQEHEFTLDQLFLFPNQLHIMKQWLKNRSGLILFTGPTGSGKTTTLYALLHHFIQERSFQTITLEDPVEKEIDHLLQVQVNEKAGITYQTGLKAALRHDPDIIMIGEIRDEPTAKFAFEAALTGHLILSTIHAKNTVGTIQRLKEMGLKESDLYQTLIAVAAIELVPVQINKQIVRRAAILEFLTGIPLEKTIKGEKIEEEQYYTFERLRRKAFAYGFISEEIYKSL